VTTRDVVVVVVVFVVLGIEQMLGRVFMPSPVVFRNDLIIADPTNPSLKR